MAYRERVGRDAESCDAGNDGVLHGGVVQHVSKGGDDTDTQLLGGGGEGGREGGRERRQTIKQNPQTKKKTFPRPRKRKSL